MKFYDTLPTRKRYLFIINYWKYSNNRKYSILLNYGNICIRKTYKNKKTA